MSETKNPPVQWRNSPEGVPNYYANMVHFLWSLDDVRFKIGQLVEPDSSTPISGSGAFALASAAVTLSWRNVKLLRDDLVGLIAAYEKVNGEIKTDVVLAPTKEEKSE